jgi:hypothetical protein
MPWPRWKYCELPSPVPAYTRDESDGSKARAPIESVGWSSVRGDHVSPPSWVSQTPPAALPTRMCSDRPGSTAIAVIRPAMVGLLPGPLP